MGRPGLFCVSQLWDNDPVVPLSYEKYRAREAELATDARARVMVFVDGQNMFKRCQDLFGHALMHPHLLAEVLSGSRTQSRVPSTRFYTGSPIATSMTLR